MRPLQEFEVALDHFDPSVFGGKRRVEPEELQGIACLGMGSLPVTMRPLWEYCQERKIEFPYQIVSDTLDAFYQMKHSGIVGFDVLKTDVPEFSWDLTSVLDGFRWEVGLLCSDSFEDTSLMTLFFRFMEQAYSTRRARYEKDYKAAVTGFDPVSGPKD